MPDATPLTDRRPNWLRKLSGAPILPPPPPEVSPAEQWEQLRTYATAAAERLREAHDVNQSMAHEIASLQRENAHIREALGAQIAELSRDSRLIRAYATSLRTRLTLIRENIVQAETEALQFASSEAGRVRFTPEEDEEAARMHAAIVRANPDKITEADTAALPPNHL